MRALLFLSAAAAAAHAPLLTGSLLDSDEPRPGALLGLNLSAPAAPAAFADVLLPSGRVHRGNATGATAAAALSGPPGSGFQVPAGARLIAPAGHYAVVARGAVRWGDGDGDATRRGGWAAFDAPTPGRALDASVVVYVAAPTWGELLGRAIDDDALRAAAALLPGSGDVFWGARDDAQLRARVAALAEPAQYAALRALPSPRPWPSAAAFRRAADALARRLLPLDVWMPDGPFAELLRPLDVEHFRAAHYQRQPLLLRRRAAGLRSGMPQSLSALVRRGNALAALGFHAHPAGDDYKLSRAGGQPELGAFPLAERRVPAGHSLVVHAAQCAWPDVAALALDAARRLGDVVNANVYATPGGGAQAVGAHFDDKEVFVLQVAGAKRWRLFDHGIVHPEFGSATSEPVPDDEPAVLDTVLRPGDALYIPAGVVHYAQSSGDDWSVHVTLGVEAARAVTWAGLLREAARPHADARGHADELAQLSPNLRRIVTAAGGHDIEAELMSILQFAASTAPSEAARDAFLAAAGDPAALWDKLHETRARHWEALEKGVWSGLALSGGMALEKSGVALSGGM